MNPGAKFHCSPGKWERIATKAATEAKLSVREFLAGAHDRRNTRLRWKLWRGLAAQGYSYASIGRASGFDHTSVMHACKCGKIPFRASLAKKREKAKKLAPVRYLGFVSGKSENALNSLPRNISEAA